MNPTTCVLPACDRPRYQTRPMCASHHMKNWRYGDPYFKQEIKFRDITGQRFGSLTAQERIGNRWSCLCDCGQTTIVRIGDLNNGNAVSCGDTRTHWRTADASYRAVHLRLRTDRGSASRHQCIDCGRQARHWAYDHTDTDERTDPATGATYSTDLAHYAPRCVPCHKRFDLDHLARLRG